VNGKEDKPGTVFPSSVEGVGKMHADVQTIVANVQNKEKQCEIDQIEIAAGHHNWDTHHPTSSHIC